MGVETSRTERRSPARMNTLQLTREHRKSVGSTRAASPSKGTWKVVCHPRDFKDAASPYLADLYRNRLDEKNKEVLSISLS